VSRRWSWGLGVAALALLLLLAGLLSSVTATSGASAASPGRLGWLATRRYLELAGVAPTLRDTPLAGTAPGGTLVTAYPASGLWSDDELIALDLFMTRGGTFLYAYSGRPSLTEELLARHLGLVSTKRRSNPNLDPRAWLSFERETWELRAEKTDSKLPGIVITAPHEAPRAPSTAHVLLRGPGGEVCGFAVARGRGRLLVLPAEALANCRISRAGNPDLLAELIATLPRPWQLDELRHGLVAGGGAHAGNPSSRAFDTLLWQLAIGYLLALVALGRRFGPPWTEMHRTSGSVVPFLLGLGRLHDRLHHHRDAAAAMLRHARDVDPRLDTAAVETAAATTVDDAEHLVDLARELASRQHHPVPRHER
jgi:hypothetical protein